MIKSLSLMTSLCLIVAMSTNTFAQAPAGASDLPHKIGLIDMAYIFKNYKKFDDRRESLKADITKTDEQARAMAEQLKGIETELKSGKFKPDSAEYQQLEARGFQLKSQFEQFSTKAKRDFLTKESEIYKEIYLEVTKAVKTYSEFYHYTLIVRFSREQIDGDEDPRELIQGMNNLVIYHNPEFDITEKVLAFLNQQYSKTVAAGQGANTVR